MNALVIPSLAALDWLVLGMLVASVVIGAWRGFAFEVLSLAGWIAAFWLAQALAGNVAEQLPMKGASQGLRWGVAFAVVFVVAAFACGIVATLGKRLVKAGGLRPVDRTLGAAFGVLRVAVILLALTAVTVTIGLQREPWWHQARSAAIMLAALAALKPLLPESLGQYLPDSLVSMPGMG